MTQRRPASDDILLSNPQQGLRRMPSAELPLAFQRGINHNTAPERKAIMFRRNSRYMYIDMRHALINTLRGPEGRNWVCLPTLPTYYLLFSVIQGTGDFIRWARYAIYSPMSILIVADCAAEHMIVSFKAVIAFSWLVEFKHWSISHEVQDLSG